MCISIWLPLKVDAHLTLSVCTWMHLHLVLSISFVSPKQHNTLISLKRSSHVDVFFKKRVLENFAKITGEHLCQSIHPFLLKLKFWNFYKYSFPQNTSSGCFSLTFKNLFFYIWNEGAVPWSKDLKQKFDTVSASKLVKLNS